LKKRVLLNQPQQPIAELLKIPIEIVQIYEKLFIDVCNRLNAKKSTVGSVPQPNMPLKSNPVGLIWSRYAFHGGVYRMS